jgi:hypothetical protein
MLLNSRTHKTEEIKSNFEIDKVDPSITIYEFLIEKPGTYKVKVEANGMGIFGSPFLCTMGDLEAQYEEERKKRELEEEKRRKEGNSSIVIFFRGRTTTKTGSRRTYENKARNGT